MARIAALFLSLPDHGFHAAELQQGSGTRARRLSQVLDAFLARQWIEYIPDAEGPEKLACRRVRMTRDGCTGLSALVAADVQHTSSPAPDTARPGLCGTETQKTPL
ncbi:hypothetical protein C5E45_20395 [Nocardia nova]|uniref:Transcriptional regulator n=1 Tax=Nocardia nova TaxID=37330 RepID=A0A2S6AME2_9NOCA|nr:hypothetical protein [Nocardia nova]PPJ36411.1 hypothetical protein C5E45_20395 [Nocardia nova]